MAFSPLQRVTADSLAALSLALFPELFSLASAMQDSSSVF